MAKIAYLDGREEIIGRLQALLKVAEEGDINAIAIVTNHTDGGVGKSYGYANGGDMWKLSGSLMATANDILNEGTDTRYEEEDDGR